MKKFQPSEFSVKKGRFGSYSLQNTDGEKLDKKQAKTLGLKFYGTDKHYTNDGDFTFTKDGAESIKCQTLYLYNENQAMIYSTSGGHFYNVNFKTGIISPEYVSFAESLYLAADGKIFKMDDDGNSIDTGYSVPEQTLRGWKFLQDNDGSLKVVDRNGKFGRIDGKGNPCCPFIFNDNNFYCTNLDKETGLVSVFDSTNNKLHVLDKDGKIIFTTDYDRENVSINKLTDNCFEIEDRSKDQTIIFEYDQENNAFKELGKLDLYVSTACRYGDDIYLALAAGKLLRLSDQKVLLDNCKSVRFEKIEGEPVVAFTESGHHKRLDTVGVYSLAEQKEILSPSAMITRISYNDSAKMDDGSYRFFCQSTVSRGNYNPASGLWGVVDDKGKALLDFEYTYDPHNKKTFIRKDKKGDVVETVLGHGYGTRYFNIKEANLIATNAEEKKIKLPKEKPESRWENFEPTLKTSKYSEEEKLAAATLASFVFESPIAGMFVYGAMDEAERE